MVHNDYPAHFGLLWLVTARCAPLVVARSPRFGRLPTFYTNRTERNRHFVANRGKETIGRSPPLFAPRYVRTQPGAN